MPSKKMGFEGEIFYGAAGSTATNRLENSRDITEEFKTTKSPTTGRGDGSAPPLKSVRVTEREYAFKFTMLVKDGDTYFAALMTASVAGTPVAIRTKSYSTGLGFNGDVVIDWSWGKPLNGEQTVDFSAEVNDDSRVALLNV